jgi:hypothetical protein
MEKNQAACRHICIRLSSALAESNVFFHNTSLTSPLFSEVPVPSQESVRPFIRCIDFKSVSVNFILKILELFWRCGIFCFLFYSSVMLSVMGLQLSIF